MADIGAGGLGLPDRDYYLKPEERFQKARARYQVHVTNMFKLAGYSDADAQKAAASVMEFETALAKASLDNVALRDPQAIDHKTTFDDLQKPLRPNFDWAAFFAALKLPTNSSERGRAEIPEGIQPATDGNFAAGLEDLPDMAVAAQRRSLPVAGVRGRELQLLPEATGRAQRDQASLEAMLDRGGPVPGRGRRAGICRTLFPARGQSPSPRDGGEHRGGHGRNRQPVGLDESRDQEESQGKDLDLRHQGRLSRQMEGLQQRQHYPRCVLR